MKIYVDIDETICINDGSSRDYSKASPILERIEKINSFYKKGHTIVYWTARGTVTGINWEDITTNQLKNWGALYHDLKFGKPDYDIFICDKAFNSKDFFESLTGDLIS